MKKILKSSILTAAIIGCGATGVSATPELFDWAFNINGTVSEIGLLSDPIPAGVNVSSFDQTTGLGSIIYTSSDSGSFLAFFDHEIVEAATTFFNETGSASGVAVAGQSWEIDEPGWVFGDIFENFENTALDNINSIPAGFIKADGTTGEDVSMAMGWNFSLDAGQVAIVTLTLNQVMPSSGFYLTQYDPDSDESIYFSSNIRITGGGPDPVPEPTTMLLMGVGLAGLLGVTRKKRK